jgi:hypothetical protein
MLKAYLFIFLFTELESPYVAQAELKLEILLPQPPECIHYHTQLKSTFKHLQG